MKLIQRTDMSKYSMPMNPWPLWCFNLWCYGAGDRYIATDDTAEQDFGIPHWKMIAWRIRGEVLCALFGWWRYV